VITMGERIFRYIGEGVGAPEPGETREEFEARMVRSNLPLTQEQEQKPAATPVIDRLTGQPIGQEKE